jgi:signal peptidase I
MHDRYLQTARELSDASLNGQDQLRLNVVSSSMAPFLRPGDHVLVRPASLGSIQRGDLIVTRREDGYLTHRLIAVDSQGWYTKGDRNHRADAPVGDLAIVGMVTAIERRGKLRSIITRPQRFIGRIQAWLGWQEITCHSLLAARFARIISRVLPAILYL